MEEVKAHNDSTQEGTYENTDGKLPITDTLDIHFPAEDPRVFDNEAKPKPGHTKSLDIVYGQINTNNVEQFKLLNYHCLPVVYRENFYAKLTSFQRYSKLAYYKDLLIGAVSCKVDLPTDDDGKE